MDKVFIEGLEVEARIGIHEWERRILQALVLDVELGFDNRVPAATDAIGDTHDYEAIGNRLVAYVSESSCGLVETLAERCATLLMDEFGVRSLCLKVSKPGALRGARAVGVVIEREREAGVSARAPVAETPAPPPAATPAQDPAAESVPAPTSDAAPVASPPPPAQHAPSASTDDARALASRFRARLRVGRETYLSLGSNIDAGKNLRSAVASLRERFGDVQVSPVYRTRPVGFEGPDFLNAVARIECDTDPFALHRWLHKLEEQHGRDGRDADYSNRPLDIDIVYFGSLVLDVGALQLPRPELRYAFVLKPMADIAPDFMDPLRETTMAELWAAHPEHDAPPARVDLTL